MRCRATITGTRSLLVTSISVIREGFLTRLPTVANRLGVALVAAFATIVLVDVVLRAADISCSADLYAPDPDLGWTHRPGLRATFAKCGREYREFQTRVRFSSLGLRDRERTLAKPAGTCRILVVGDSYTEALQVDASDTFVAKLERLLAEDGAAGSTDAAARPQLEVINGGVAGYGTDNELLWYQRDLWKLDADLVVLVMSPNDLYENTRELFENGPILYPDKPYFQFEDGRLEVHNRPVPPYSPPHRSRRERALDELHRDPLYRLITGTPRPPGRDDVRYVGKGGRNGQAVMLEQYLPEPSDVWRRAFLMTRALVSELRAAVEGHGSRFAVVVLPDDRAVQPGLLELSVKSLDLSGEIDAERPYRQLLEIARASGVPSVGLLPAFKAQPADGPALFLTSDPHYTVAGHAVVAGVLKEFFTSQGLLAACS